MWLWTVQLFWILLIFVNLCQSQHFLNDAQENYLGCYFDFDAANRLLGGLHHDFPGTLTQNICNRFCFDKGFAFAGTENSFQCFCSTNRPPDDQKLPDSQCNTKCAGNSTKICGATWRISVYSTGYVPSIRSDTQESYLGCYMDSGIRLLGASFKHFPGTLTQNICTRFCLDNGFSFAGTEFSAECFCSMIRPPDDKILPENQCNSKCAGNNEKICGGFWKISVYNTAFMPTARSDTRENYVGCYIDAPNRLLGGLFKDFPGSLTQNLCNQLCSDQGFPFAGTEISQCYCSMNRPPDNKKAPDSECNTKCAGNVDRICGGIWRISVYSTGYVPPKRSDTQENYLGCYIDSGIRLLGGLQTDFPETLTQNICNQHCQDKGFAFAGTEFSLQCFCSMNRPSDDKKVPDDQCDTNCAGNGDTKCGALWRISVYSIAPTKGSSVETIENRQASPDDNGITTGPTVNPSKCLLSQSFVNGKNICKGDVIFEDEFSSSLGDKWKHVVMILGAPDHEFTVFRANPQNSFVSNNQLIIKPTIYDDVHTLTGALNLEGCTGFTPGKRECGYQASKDNILPPVASARINTRHSFSFRYGIVEIKAKMPVGDWLVPELWLEPKNRFYGKNYASGRIHLAMSRGNRVLNCGGKDYGSNRLEAGVVMGPENDVRVCSITSTVPNNWHDQFHTYTLIWKPDGIAFKIDNEMPQDILPKGGRLCDDIGFTNEICKMWESGLNIAPFDTEFYISLGLSAGNTRAFPDNCMNRGNPKPWRNLEEEAMLKFWQDKGNWSTTWSDEKSALYIEHIRVTAL